MWFVFELVIWPQEVTLARWTQPSGPLCLWQCLMTNVARLDAAMQITWLALMGTPSIHNRVGMRRLSIWMDHKLIMNAQDFRSFIDLNFEYGTAKSFSCIPDSARHFQLAKSMLYWKLYESIMNNKVWNLYSFCVGIKISLFRASWEVWRGT